MLSLTYEEYRQAIDDGKFQEDQVEKILFLTEEVAREMNISMLISKCMQYTLDNHKEVIFKYDPASKKPYGNVYIGDERRCNAFYTKEELDIHKYLASFHTHALSEGDGFGILDMKDFANPRYTQIMVGCAPTRKIYLLKKSVLVKHPDVKRKVELLYARAMNVFVRDFLKLYQVSADGKVIPTEKGIALDYEYVRKLKKLLLPALTIINW